MEWRLGIAESEVADLDPSGLKQGQRLYSHPDLRVGRRVASLYADRIANSLRSRRLDPTALSVAVDPGAVAYAPPVFIIGAGWRSGTTALQRLVAGGGGVGVWGEPYTDALLLPRLLLMLDDARRSPSTRRNKLKGPYDASVLSQQWIASLYPPTEAIVAAVRGFVEALFWQPLCGIPGIQTFGIKEVAMKPAHLDLLRASFPEARWILVVRNPTSAYRSFRRFARGAAYAPDTRGSLRVIAGPVAFARHWRELATWILARSQDENVLSFRYEDALEAGDFPSRVAAHIRQNVDPIAWSTPLGGRRIGPTTKIERGELALVQALCTKVADDWGY